MELSMGMRTASAYPCTNYPPCSWTWTTEEDTELSMGIGRPSSRHPYSRYPPILVMDMDNGERHRPQYGNENRLGVPV